MLRQLTCHPATPCKAVDRIEVEIAASGRQLDLRYVVRGCIDEIRFPSAAEQASSEELWRDTCFEMFARTKGDAAYDELNLSPSGKWIQFGFLAYRSGRDVLGTVPPGIATASSTDRFELAGTGVLPEHGPWQLGLSAVVEETDGTKSYWALAHPPGQPDFHHPDCFALELPAAG